jgi:hypothetical protein
MTDLSLVLGEVKGRLDSLQEVHDRHAEITRLGFDEIRGSIAELKIERAHTLARASVRHGLVETVKWAFMLVAAAVSGHVAGGH